MTTSLKFILGDRDLLKSRERKTIEDHSPIPIRGKINKPKGFVYNRSCGFSVRTNRDKYQTPGELYMGDNDLEQVTNEISGPSLVKRRWR